MYHSRWRGSNREAGYKYGDNMHKNGKDLDIDKLVDEEKLKYSEQVYEIYYKHYPEIIEEIKGFAEGLRMDFVKVFAFLTTMYVFTYENYCSIIGTSNKNGIFLARNSDFDKSIQKLTDSAYYKLDKGYSFIGNTTAMIQMEDGMNEKGLACGLTFVYPTEKGLGFNAGFLIRYILEKCATIRESREFLENVEIGSSQNIIVADRNGDVLLAELNSKRKYFEQISKGALYRTNHFVSKKMRLFKCDLNDDIRSHDRYNTLEKENYTNYRLEDIRELLSGKRGFLCQYEKKQSFDTIWSSIYDIANNKIYRSEGNPSRRKFIEDKRWK
ncbi:C45 family autoproteolytic acyltransferase/hydolase [Peptostreptococcus faecalis]|uniref:C45 family autoproteolytic acyltransferase/hydolase n=1 Tax=Peptostreptococcus faecalis TaxID=2045015 RepID=UPI000C7DB15C|nr:C45 family autoproteolytic acyltransferase/hydolase [Peptostreptococcus faecalis]